MYILEVMNATTYTAAREELATIMDRVCNDHEPIIVTRKRDQSVVMISLDDYKALEETAYLLRNPGNAKRLLDSLSDFNSGRGQVRNLSEI